MLQLPSCSGEVDGRRGESVLTSVSKYDPDIEYLQRTHAVEVINILFTLFKDSVEIKILKALCRNNACSLRGLARHVGVHHTNLPKHIARLADLGLIEQESIGRMRVIRLKNEYTFLSHISF